jgi:hypothetical protein
MVSVMAVKLLPAASCRSKKAEPATGGGGPGFAVHAASVKLPVPPLATAVTVTPFCVSLTG